MGHAFEEEGEQLEFNFAEADPQWVKMMREKYGIDYSNR